MIDTITFKRPPTTARERGVGEPPSFARALLRPAALRPRPPANAIHQPRRRDDDDEILNHGHEPLVFVVLVQRLPPRVRLLRGRPALPLHLRNHPRVHVILRVLPAVRLAVRRGEPLSLLMVLRAHHPGPDVRVRVHPSVSIRDEIIRRRVRARDHAVPEPGLGVLRRVDVGPALVEDAVARRRARGHHTGAEAGGVVLAGVAVRAILREDALARGVLARDEPAADARLGVLVRELPAVLAIVQARGVVLDGEV
ncbi:uncharacterized protein MICPUCDRAFT_65600 [Micromonas pusilla CCMP1545]|uniref:Predicted protein n=1 Tax=Micromonas pusilla (strain CCMP1545) TaxID=564608 RepID=C1MWB3_MICPC|nr:uncharacterized protein MICPUCDRAFT_65600 [Micromonas pusilla CCMP1545]EEH56137.1 predicted protein [Micromonas pusilla CCMP1545]|eukprot:XP_003060185.1 predicted protein [Micromonas pusilla CCMP1545]